MIEAHPRERGDPPGCVPGAKILRRRATGLACRRRVRRRHATGASWAPASGAFRPTARHPRRRFRGVA